MTVAMAAARIQTKLRSWTCNYCKTGLCRSCPGVVRVNAELWICKHGEQHRAPYCLDCKNESTDDVDPVHWRCLDRHACATRVQVRQENNELYQMIVSCIAAGDLERKRKRLDTERALELIDPVTDAEIELLHDAENRADQAAGVERKQTKPKPPPRPTSGVCECGCEGKTKGGKFVPGHDAKLASALKKLIEEFDPDAYAEMKRRGWLKKLPKALRERMETTP